MPCVSPFKATAFRRAPHANSPTPTGPSADRIGELLEQGAYVYICGDGAHMAPAVRTAIGEILAGADGSADDAITTLTEAHRYHEDVWAGA